MSVLAFLIVKKKEKIDALCAIKCLQKQFNPLLSEKKTKSTMFLLKTLTHSYMFILYFVEESIFVIIVYKLLVQKKH